jgi:hypothetical protein
MKNIKLNYENVTLLLKQMIFFIYIYEEHY